MMGSEELLAAVALGFAADELATCSFEAPASAPPVEDDDSPKKPFLKPLPKPFAS